MFLKNFAFLSSLLRDSLTAADMNEILHRKARTCSSALGFVFVLGESPFSVPHRFNALSNIEGVEAGLRLPELRSGGVL